MKIEPQRLQFWQEFVSNIAQEIKHKFAEGPKPFKTAEDKIYQIILSQIILILDSYLIVAITEHINKQNHDSLTTISTQYYDNFFAGGFEKTLHLLNTHYSSTLSAIYKRCRLFKSHFAHAFDRIFKDWDELKNQFNLSDEDTLETVRLFAGDIHSNGGQTSLFIFNGGKKGFAYKPNDLSIIQFYNSLMRYIQEAHGFLVKKIPEVIVKNHVDTDKYGYIDFVSYQSNVHSKKEAEAVYENFGKVLAFARFFKITDGHCDNIIIHAPDVYWVDLENSFHFPRPEVLEAVHQLETTGLLYEAKKETTLLGIITGLQGGSMPRLILNQPLAENDGTDKMYIRYFGLIEETTLSRKNRIYLDNQLCNPYDFIESIQNGYKFAMRKLITHQDYILDFIKVYFSQHEITVRHIFKPTACYSRFLNLMNHPLSNKTADAFLHIQKELSALCHEKDTAKSFILENELMDLSNQVIPYFYKTNFNKHIYHSSGLCMKNFFEKDIFTEFSETVKYLTLFDIENDVAFIEKALRSSADINSWEKFKHKFDYTLFDYEHSPLQYGID